MGHTPLIASVMRVTATHDPAPHPGPFQALVVTSRNAAQRLPLGVDRATPAWAVGASTAAALRAAGFTRVAHAGGDALDLARLVAAQASPDGGPLLYPCGRHRTGRLAERLSASGFDVALWEVYDTASLALAPSVRADLARNVVDATLLYSPRSAAAFGRAVSGQRVGGALLCLSPNVAAALPARLRARAMCLARPSEAGLLGCLGSFTP